MWAPSHGRDLRLDQSLVGHSHNLCATLTPAHLTGRTDCRSKIMCLGWCPNSCTGSLAWSQGMTGSDYISSVAGSLSCSVVGYLYTV